MNTTTTRETFAAAVVNYSYTAPAALVDAVKSYETARADAETAAVYLVELKNGAKDANRAARTAARADIAADIRAAHAAAVEKYGIDNVVSLQNRAALAYRFHFAGVSFDAAKDDRAHVSRVAEYIDVLQFAEDAAAAADAVAGIVTAARAALAGMVVNTVDDLASVNVKPVRIALENAARAVGFSHVKYTARDAAAVAFDLARLDWRTADIKTASATAAAAALLTVTHAYLWQCAVKEAAKVAAAA